MDFKPTPLKTILHKADTRGHIQHGWLDTYHSFSFGDYHDASRMGFGALRVLNDDIIAAGQGFGAHPHANIEIITIPLEGALAHRDSMGNEEVLSAGAIQVMSAGSGIAHSEYNASEAIPVKLLQIWILPHQQNVTPRYADIIFAPEGRQNKWQQIVGPHRTHEGAWIHQDAWLSLGAFTTETPIEYAIKKPGNGAYVFMISGEAYIGDQTLHARDGYGVWDTPTVPIIAGAASEILIIEVPMG